MQEQDIEAYLAELGQELTATGMKHPVRILMVGGAFMLTQIHNRATTNDVDILLLDIDDPDSSAYKTFKSVVRSVAKKLHIPITWINDVIGDFLRDSSIIPSGTLWRAYGILHIYIPPKEYILALKLLANRPKDQVDIQALCQQLGIHTRHQALALVNQYIPDRLTQELNNLDETLDQFFP